MLDWYHLYLNQPCSGIIANTTQQLYHWTVLVIQADISVKLCNICQQVDKFKRCHGQRPPKINVDMKPWSSLYIDLIWSYYKSKRHQNPDGAIIQKCVSLTCILMLDPTTVCFEIIKFPWFYLDEVVADNK